MNLLYFLCYALWIKSPSYHTYDICLFCVIDFTSNVSELGKELGRQGTVRVLYYVLSHTWVRYPGFSGHGVKCPMLTTVVPGFSGDLIGCTIRSKWGSFGDLYRAKKNRLCVWNKLFLVEIDFSQRRTRPVKSLWWQIVHMQESTNEWKNLKIFEIMGLAGTQW